MKKAMLVGVAVLVGLMAAGSAYAANAGSEKGQSNTATEINIKTVKKFLKTTSDARNDLVIKRIELVQVLVNDPTNYDKIAEIRKDIIDLKTKVMDTAKKFGLDEAVIRYIIIKRAIQCGNTVPQLHVIIDRGGAEGSEK